MDKKKATLPNTNSAGAKVVSTWNTRTSAVDNPWTGVCWAPELGLFAAVSFPGSLNEVMTSPDGITWTARTTPADNQWRGICWSPDLRLFCAVSATGTANRVMTSSDGITWTSRSTTGLDNNWRSVCWASELGLFVAVSDSGVGNRVMTSSNGTAWTLRTSASDIGWISVCWAPELGLLCAVSQTSSGVMTSPDGINWTLRSASSANTWQSVCWSPEQGTFVAVSLTATGSVMTSPDGITWTARTASVNNDWTSVCWASDIGLFVAVAASGTATRIMSSPDGITWTTRTSAADNNWVGVCWSSELGIFVAVATTGTGNRVMISSLPGRPPTSCNVFDSPFNRIDSNGNWYFSSGLTTVSLSTSLISSGITNTGGINIVSSIRLNTDAFTVDSNGNIISGTRTAGLGNGNMYIYNTQSNQYGPNLSFYTNSNGGNSASNSELGYIGFWGQAGGNFSRGAMIIAYQNGAPNSCNLVPADLRFYTQHSTLGQYLRMAITTEGNVGIGTAIPTNALEVIGTSKLGVMNIPSSSGPVTVNTTASYGTLQLTAATGAVENGVFVRDPAQSGNNGWLLGNSASFVNNASTFVVGRFSNSTALGSGSVFITPDGNVGIGKSNATNKLDIIGATISITNTSLGGSGSFSQATTNSNSQTQSYLGYIIDQNSAGFGGGAADSYCYRTYAYPNSGNGGGAYGVYNISLSTSAYGSVGDIYFFNNATIAKNTTTKSAVLGNGSGTSLGRFLSYSATVRPNSDNNTQYFTIKTKSDVECCSVFENGSITAISAPGNSVLSVGKDSVTSRSINATGSVNANGADFAEYMKKNSDFTISKGDIVGVDSNGELTQKWSESKSFVIKSTEPGLVGGSSWGDLPQKPNPSSNDMTPEQIAQREQELLDWQIQVNEIRKPYDRIAFAGRVPVNIVNAAAGDYIVANEGDNDIISASVVTNADISFDSYKRTVGRVLSIMDDGRAYVSVIIH